MCARVCLFATPWTVARQAPLCVGFPRQEYWSGLPCPPPGDLPCPGIEPEVLTSPALIGGFFTTRATWEAQQLRIFLIKIVCYICIFKPETTSVSHLHEIASGSCSSLHLLLFSHLVISNSFQPHGPHHTRLPCPSPSPRAFSNSLPLSQ